MAAVPITTAIQTSVANLYISILGRNPEPAGFGYWTNALANNGGTPAAVNAIAIGFSGSPEFVATYGGLTTAQAVNTFYTNILNRTADAVGSTYWQGIANGYIASGYTISQAYALTANSLIITAAANTGTADATLIANKETAAIATGTAAPSTTYTLTTNIETITGASNIIVNGVTNGTTATAADTLQAGDSIQLTGTNNVLNVTSTLTNTAVNNSALISGVQTENIRSVAGTASLDASTIASLTAVNSNLSAGVVTVTNLASGATAGVIGNGTLVNGASNFGWAAKTTAATVNVSGGVTAGTITTSSGDTAMVSNTINSTGAANVLGALTLGANVTGLTINATTNLTTGAITNTTAAALKTIAITGAGNVDISGGALQTTTTTVTDTGSGTLKVILGTGVTSFTGGSGATTVTTAATTAANAVINGGTSGSNTLILAATNDVTTSAKAAEYTNFQTLQNNTTASVDASLFAGVTAYTLNSAGAGGFNNLGSTSTVGIIQTSAGGTLSAVSGTTGTLNANLGGTTAATVVSATTLSTAGFSTLNLGVNSGITTAITAANAGTLAADTLSFTASTNLKTVNVNGAYDAVVDLSSNATGVTAVNLSGNTAGAVVKLAANTANLTVTGSNGASYYVLNTPNGGTVSINGGTGKDYFIGSAAQVVAANINSGSGADSLELNNTGTVSISDSTFANVTAVETLITDATTGITWQAGGYVNGLATANAGLINVTAANLALTAISSLDFSTLSGTNAVNLSVTDAGTATGGLTLTITGSLHGNDTVTLATGALATDQITISETGSGNHTIKYSGFVLGGAASSLAISLGSGTDVVTGGVGPVGTAHSTIITAGTGSSTINLAASHSSTEISAAVAGQSTLAAFAAVSNFTENTTDITADYIHFANTTVLSASNLNTNGATGWSVSNGVATKTGAAVADFLAAVSTETGAAGTAAFSDGSNTWVAYGAGTGVATGSHVIELVGVHNVTAVAAATYTATTVTLI